MTSKLIALGVLLATMNTFGWAHDEGHGPKLTDTPRQGGVLAPVIAKAESKRGAKATVLYKAELVRMDDGSIAVYLYDTLMKPLDLKGFDPLAKAQLEIGKKGHFTHTPFTLTLHGDHFMGQAPKPSRKPFNVDVYLNKDGQTLLTAFDNLD